jgi:hypothetical protein
VIDLESLSAFRALLAEHEEKIDALRSDVIDMATEITGVREHIKMLSQIADGLTSIVRRHEEALRDER